MKLTRAFDLDKRILEAVNKLGLDHIQAEQVVAFRSTGATARARARIYAMPRIWQEALGVKPHYCIEFLSQHFDGLSKDDQWRVIIHELMHIPKTFSGALLPHRGKGRRDQVSHRTVEQLFKKLKDDEDYSR